MNKKDREFFEDVGKHLRLMPKTFDASVVINLWAIIDRLDKQLTGLVERSQPFVDLAEDAKEGMIEGVDIPYMDNEGVHQVWALTESDYRRLAQEIRKVKDDG